MIRILFLLLLFPALSFGQHYSATIESGDFRRKYDMGMVSLSFRAKTVSVRYDDSGRTYTYPVIAAPRPYLLTRDKRMHCTDFWIVQRQSVVRIWSNQLSGHYGRITYKLTTSRGSNPSN